MSTWANLRRELAETEMTDAEWRALRTVLGRGIRAGLPPHANIEMPGVTEAGKAYLLEIPTDADGKPTKIVVDLNPDLSSPAFDAYVDFCNDPSRGERIPLPQPTDSGEGER